MDGFGSIDNAFKRKVEYYEHEVSKLEAELTSYKKQVERMRRDNIQLQGEIQKLKEEIKELREEILNITKRVNPLLLPSPKKAKLDKVLVQNTQTKVLRP